MSYFFTDSPRFYLFKPSGGDSTLILTSTSDPAPDTEQRYFNVLDGASVLMAEFINLNSNGGFIPSPQSGYDIELRQALISELKI